jgi:hypothetical protein
VPNGRCGGHPGNEPRSGVGSPQSVDCLWTEFVRSERSLSSRSAVISSRRLVGASTVVAASPCGEERFGRQWWTIRIVPTRAVRSLH